MLATSVSLDDKYTADEGRVFMTGLQTLVRLPMTQMRRDRAAGLNTAAFISGYRGSPLGGYDQQLLKAKTYLDAHDVTFQPGINEDLAATAVWGTQQVGLSPGVRKDGVLGIWYGKGPGVDRSGDVLAMPMPPAPRNMAVCSVSPATTIPPNPPPFRTRPTMISCRR